MWLCDVFQLIKSHWIHRNRKPESADNDMAPLAKALPFAWQTWLEVDLVSVFLTVLCTFSNASHWYGYNDYDNSHAPPRQVCLTAVCLMATEPSGSLVQQSHFRAPGLKKILGVGAWGTKSIPTCGQSQSPLHRQSPGKHSPLAHKNSVGEQCEPGTFGLAGAQFISSAQLSQSHLPSHCEVEKIQLPVVGHCIRIMFQYVSRLPIWHRVHTVTWKLQNLLRQMHFTNTVRHIHVGYTYASYTIMTNKIVAYTS